jgi:hypothetical protein
MKEIIGGKRYNTETATKIAENSSRCGRGDFRWFQESLYLTKKGSWFLAGEGYAMSKYAEAAGGNLYGPGEKIIPLDAEGVIAWLEAAGNIDILEKYFKDAIQDA